MPEAGRQIVKEEMYIGSDALPWKDKNKLVDLLLSRAMFQFNAARPRSGVVFFDRSIVEPVSGMEDRGQPVASYALRAAQQHRYARRVFMAPPWEEIFANDAERPYRFADVAVGYEALVSAYERFGYEPVVIPKVSVTERADFIEAQLQLGFL